ncbi:uncharacterized protein LOC8280086 isoform X1 [Ricinus communis]|uniref:uncharacterized protein LOC8280086 isoform X1 n=1 Tax=Ricinus communis TaxID=3988 RepID=UPI000772BC82|nr:uncharacterized protein LOC8280086 isoform X1 [Ricinus communis]|eukprot:XP_015575130.1 uncharacterized protein LOC8280086 isoform X2 [Ricinus communis]
MDSEEERETEVEMEENDNKGLIKYGVGFVFRLTLAFLFPIFAFLMLSIVIGLLAVLGTYFSITSPIFFPSQCTILSSSVDLRSSKVCELGLLNYKAKHVFYPFESSQFRCRYDYYWASVFQVEYKDHSLGQTQLAFSEAPNEALPLNCRPNFGAAWVTKNIFKVNKTYDCWYTIGISRVSLYRDGFFPCQAKDPSAFEMLRRCIILSIKTLRHLFVQKKGIASFWRWETVAGVVTGFSTSLISISCISILHHIKSRLSSTYIARMVAPIIKMVSFKRVCFLVTYFSIVGWLVIQYGKWLGLPDIHRMYNY